MIDINRLTRDYTKYPLKLTKNGINSEKLSKDELLYLYIELNMMAQEIADYLNIPESRIRSWCHIYGIHKDTKLVNNNVKKICLERYGVENASQYQAFKNKTKQTNLKKYGVENTFQCEMFKDKAKQTCLKKYGVENIGKLESTHQKMIKTCLKRYGVNHYNQTIASKVRYHQTYLKKYGVNHYMQQFMPKESYEIIKSAASLKAYISNLEIKSYSYISQSLGISKSALYSYIQKYQLQDMIEDLKGSKYEETIYNMYDNFKRHDRTILEGQEIDLLNIDKNLGIEFNGDFWHTERTKNEYYHQDKSLKALSKGVFLYHIFEYEWLDKRDIILDNIDYLLGNIHQKIGARKCTIKEVDNITKSLFLNNNSLNNDDSKIAYGLYYKNDLMMIMTFKQIDGVWNIMSCCSKINYIIVGGISKLLKAFLAIYCPNNIQILCDLTHYYGFAFEKLGFKLKWISEPSFVWYYNNEIYEYEPKDKNCSKIFNSGYFLWELNIDKKMNK